MSGPARKFDLGPLLPEGRVVKKIEVEAPEDEADKTLRLRKDWWSFVVKDLGPYVLSFLFVLLIGLYCLYVVAHHGVASAEAKLVLPMITTLFGGVVGMVIGKATK